MHCVHIIKSEKTGSHYYGHSKDLNMRLEAHNNGKVRSTKANCPWKIHYLEEVHFPKLW